MRKIAIVGTAPDSVKDAPFHDKSWEIWSLGANADVFLSIPNSRFNRWFELHTFTALKLANALPQHRLDFFKRIGNTLTIGHDNCELPEAVMYPKDAVIADIGREYFTSSIAWLIALAIHEKVDVIGLWGVNMIGDGEYSHQRACCEFLLGVAQGRGIKVELSQRSPLLRAERMYAFEYTTLAGETQENIEKSRKMAKEADDRFLKALEDRAFAQGRLSVLHDVERRWG